MFAVTAGLYDCCWSEENENILISASGDGSIKVDGPLFLQRVFVTSPPSLSGFGNLARLAPAPTNAPHANREYEEGRQFRRRAELAARPGMLCVPLCRRGTYRRRRRRIRSAASKSTPGRRVGSSGSPAQHSIHGFALTGLTQSAHGLTLMCSSLPFLPPHSAGLLSSVQPRAAGLLCVRKLGLHGQALVAVAPALTAHL